jgi:hypothetical protein
MEGDSYLVARGNDEARRTLPQTERLGRRIARQPPARMQAQALRGHRFPAAAGRRRIGDFARWRLRLLDAGDPDRRGVQPRLLQGEARQGPADAQPRHQRDVHRDDRALALRVERRKCEAAGRPGPVRRDLVSGRRGAAVHERHVRRTEARAPADVHHRRQPAAGRVHAAGDAALRAVAAGASSSPRASAANVFTSATATNSVATSSAAAATPFHRPDGWFCA